MVVVRCLYGALRDGVATELWISDKVGQAINGHVRKGWLLGKLLHYAKNGFGDFTGAENYPIKAEGEGVFRIRDNKQFRIIGFYDGIQCSCFIAIDCFTKRKAKYGQQEASVVARVASVKKSGDWRKQYDD